MKLVASLILIVALAACDGEVEKTCGGMRGEFGELFEKIDMPWTDTDTRDYNDLIDEAKALRGEMVEAGCDVSGISRLKSRD